MVAYNEDSDVYAVDAFGDIPFTNSSWNVPYGCNYDYYYGTYYGDVCPKNCPSKYKYAQSWTGDKEYYRNAQILLGSCDNTNNANTCRTFVQDCYLSTTNEDFLGVLYSKTNNRTRPEFNIPTAYALSKIYPNISAINNSLKLIDKEAGYGADSYRSAIKTNAATWVDTLSNGIFYDKSSYGEPSWNGDPVYAYTTPLTQSASSSGTPIPATNKAQAILVSKITDW